MSIGRRDQLAKVWVLTRTNFRRTAGDRRFPALVLAFPVLVMLLVGLTFGAGGHRVAVGVIGGDGPVAARFVSDLGASPALKVRRYRTAGAMRFALRRGTVLAAVVIPPDFGTTLRAGGRAEVEVLSHPGRVEAAVARLGVADVAGREADAVSAALAAQRSGVPFGAALLRAERQSTSLARRAAGGRSLSPFSYTTPGNLVLFVFITSLVTAVRPVQDRVTGLTRRVLASPTPPWVVVAGDAVTAFVVALGQGVLLLALGAALFGVRWGSPAGTALLVGTLALAGGATGLLFSTMLRTPEQAVATGVPVGIGMGMLGGCMWSLSTVGAGLRFAGHVVPTAWAMDGFVALVYGRAALGRVLPDVLALAAFGFGLLAIAVAQLRVVVARA